MDAQFEVFHVVKGGDLKSEASVLATLSSDYNRKKSVDSSCLTNGACDTNDQDRRIDEIWEQRLLNNPKLFNATKFRTENVISETIEDKDVVHFYLGVTDYKEFIGTNWAPNAHELQRKGEELVGNSQAFLSDALGVGAAVVTKDNYLVLIRRSEHCAEAPSLYDVPGGHAEPKEIVGDLSLQDIDASTMEGDVVVHEIFDSIMREIVDEVNIPREALEPPLYTGTHRNKLSAGRPSAAFDIRCSLTRDEVHKLYSQGSQLEADESTNIMFIHFDDLATLNTHRKDIWEQLAPSARGNLTVFCVAHGLKTC